MGARARSLLLGVVRDLLGRQDHDLAVSGDRDRLAEQLVLPQRLPDGLLHRRLDETRCPEYVETLSRAVRCLALDAHKPTLRRILLHTAGRWTEAFCNRCSSATS